MIVAALAATLVLGAFAASRAAHAAAGRVLAWFTGAL